MEVTIWYEPSPLTPNKRYCGVGMFGQYFSENEYANYLFYIVSNRFNNLSPMQNPYNYLEKNCEL